MCQYKVIPVIVIWIINVCVCEDLYRYFTDVTHTSSTANYPFNPGKCKFQIGNGKLYSARNYRRFHYPDANYSCLHFHCTGTGAVDLIYRISGCHHNEKCIRFGERFTDNQCRTWTCSIDYNAWLSSKTIKMGLFLDRVKTKCQWNGECLKRGQEVYDEQDCVTKRCTIYGRPFGRWGLGETQHWQPISAGCKVDNVCQKADSNYAVGCSTYRCSNKIITRERQLPDGRYIKDYSIYGGVSFVKEGCKRFNNAGCLEVGDHTRVRQCIEYTCMANGSNILTSEGCPNALTKQCGNIGSIISPLPCVKLQCVKVDNVYSYRYESEGCYNGLKCTDVGQFGYQPKTQCYKKCHKVYKGEMILYKLAGGCISKYRHDVYSHRRMKSH